MPKTPRPTTPARNSPRGPANPLVVALAYDGLCLFEFGIVTELFGLPRPEFGADWYRFAVAGVDPGPLRALGGLRLSVDGGLDLLEQAGTIVIPGWRGAEAPVPPALIAALVAAHGRGARLLSICSGVFVLAATGLLEGRRVTTHWRYEAALARLHPQLRFEPNRLYVDEGQILTSAGSAAGIDLGLHLMRRDYGPEIANRVARRMVVPAHREGGQAQFIERPVPPAREGQRLGPLIEWMRTRLDQPHNLADLARQAGMSLRSFQRRFQATTGASPADWLTGIRLDRARELLEGPPRPIEDIALACGFGSAQTLRHHFRARLGTSPAAYRACFAGTESVASLAP